MTTKLSCICPTIGRISLEKVLEIIVPQLKDGDEFIVVGDGSYPETRELVAKYPPAQYIELETGPHGDYGCTALDFAMPQAKGDFIFFIGDDDIPTFGAFETIRDAVEGTAEPHLFAVLHTGRMLLGEFSAGGVTGQQIVFPNIPSKIPKMAIEEKRDWQVSDWVFVNAVNTAWDYKTHVHNDLIATIPIQRYGS